MIVHDFSKFRRNFDVFFLSLGDIFWIRGFVDVSDGILLVWFSIDSIYFLICFEGNYVN